MIYCQANLTDGFIPAHAIESFGVRARNKSTVADELCRALVPGKGPLWHRVDDGFQIHDYLEWNDSREEILKERERTKNRVQSFRNRKRGNGGGNALQGTLQTAFGTGAPQPLPQDTPTEERGSAAPPAAKPERRTSPNRSGVSNLLDHYTAKYLAVVGMRPHIQRPKDPQLLTQLLRQHDEETVRRAMDALFESDDRLVLNNGYSIGIFKSQFNGLLVRVNRVVTGSGAERRGPVWECKHVDRCGHRAMCEVKLAQPAKYPVRQQVPA